MLEQQRKGGPSFAANEAKESSGFAKPVRLNGQLRKDALERLFYAFCLIFLLTEDRNKKMDETEAAEVSSS